MEKASNSPVISVLVPVYNVAPYLDRCLKSILSQSYQNYEIILVDDGSTDQSPAICDKYARSYQNVKVFHKKNGGLSSARNFGVAHASGKYLTFVDSDDYVEKTYLNTLVHNLEQNDCDLSMVKHCVRYPRRTINHSTGDKEILTVKQCLYKMLYDDDVDVSAWGKLYRKELFNGVSYPEGEKFEDSSTTVFLIAHAQKIFLNSTPLYNYIIRDNSITESQFDETNLELISATKKMTAFIQKKYPDLKSGCKRRLMYAYLSVFRKYALSNNRKKYSTYGTKIYSYIKKHRKTILKDPKIPRRDRFALICAANYHFFLFSIIFYEKIRRTK